MYIVTFISCQTHNHHTHKKEMYQQFDHFNVEDDHYVDINNYPICDDNIKGKMRIIRDKETNIRVAQQVAEKNRFYHFMKYCRSWIPNIEDVYLAISDPLLYADVFISTLVLVCSSGLVIGLLLRWRWGTKVSSYMIMGIVWFFFFFFTTLIGSVIFLFTQIQRLATWIWAMFTFEKIMRGSNYLYYGPPIKIQKRFKMYDDANPDYKIKETETYRID